MNRIFLIIFIGIVGVSASINHFEIHNSLPDPVYALPTDSLQINLGRSLFYDPILSKDSTISCATCHSPYNAFAHTDHALSHGIDDRIGTRNAPALFNLAWQKSFMWDGAINHIEVQALAPINHPDEMGESTKNVIEKIKRSRYYQQKFRETFGDSTINSQRFLKAIAAFQLSLISNSSKYDQVAKGISEFTEQEKKGYQIFQNNCGSCHVEPLFSDYSFKNNGLIVDSILLDSGLMRISQNPNDLNKFKVPSLRNLKFTFPYMHDGRFVSLRQVIDHYTDLDLNTPNLDPQLKQKINLTSEEETDLISFLNTLNDNAFVFDQSNKFPMELIEQRRK